MPIVFRSTAANDAGFSRKVHINLDTRKLNVHKIISEVGLGMLFLDFFYIALSVGLLYQLFFRTSSQYIYLEFKGQDVLVNWFL